MLSTQKQLSTYVWGSGDASHKRSEYFVVLPEGHTYSDLFNPEYWGALEKERKLRVHDIIRVRAKDGSFDAVVTIVALATGMARVEPWPNLPAKIAASAGDPSNLRPVPLLANGLPAVRVEPAGPDNWRVVGINQSAHSTHRSELEAQGSMAAYLSAMRMRPMSEEEMAEALVEYEAQRQARRHIIEQKKAETQERMLSRRARPQREVSAG